jgi:hypothetical protein
MYTKHTLYRTEALNSCLPFRELNIARDKARFFRLTISGFAHHPKQHPFLSVNQNHQGLQINGINTSILVHTNSPYSLDTMAAPIDYANLPTPPACVADFCLIPVSLLGPCLADIYCPFLLFLSSAYQVADWYTDGFCFE